MRQLPSKSEILDWIRDNPRSSGKREIAKAFGLKGSDRIELKQMLRELQDSGEIETHRRHLRPAGALPPVAMLRVLAPDADGDLFAVPLTWEHDTPPPKALLIQKRAGPSLGGGDRVLAKLRPVEDDAYSYEARPIKKIDASESSLIGIFRKTAQGGRIAPVEKRGFREWTVAAADTGGARDGELVEAIALPGPKMGLPRGRVLSIHGDPGAPRQVSLIAMVHHQIPHEFPEDVLAEAKRAKPIEELGDRTDLRDLPLITIDPSDARDHDDAICAGSDEDPANQGGHVVWVAIADVAHYVRPGSKLDREARTRGNSTYFPDRVSPMLPESLSADLCSLHEGAVRPCLAVRMVLNERGDKIGHTFVRGLMKSPASLAYEDVQAAIDTGEGLDPELIASVLRPLYAAYSAAAAAKNRRQPLDLDLPERKIEIDEQGRVASIGHRDRLDAHRLIEEFMILANVCAAETLEASCTPLLYRVHEEPNPDKLDALREMIESIGLTLAKGQVLKTRHFNDLLKNAYGTEHADAVAMSVLRTQTQAYYASKNFGHFGLSLQRYAHFTSPIRRYADLLVHRALIKSLKLGPDGLDQTDVETLDQTAEHISMTERRSMDAERDTVDRYMAAYLADRQGAEFTGRIAGVSRAGAFVRLDETGADGLVPISTLGADYFRHDRDTQTLTGERSGRVLGLGMRVTVRLIEATPMTGGLILEILSVDGKEMRAGQRNRGKSGSRKQLSRARIKKTKAARLARKKR